MDMTSLPQGSSSPPFHSAWPLHSVHLPVRLAVAVVQAVVAAAVVQAAVVVVVAAGLPAAVVGGVIATNHSATCQVQIIS